MYWLQSVHRFLLDGWEQAIALCFGRGCPYSTRLVLAILVCSGQAQVSALGLDAAPLSQEPVSLTEYFEILEDPGLGLSFSDVRKPEVAARFKSGQAPAAALNYGFTRSAYWLKLRLHNSSDQPIERMLEIASPRHASLQFFQPVAVPDYQMVDTGYLKPFFERPYKNRFFVFPVVLPPQSERVLYLRFYSSPSAMEIPARLWAPHAFHAYERSDYMSQAWYFGMLMAMVAFNLLLFVALRDISYLLYVLFASCTAVAMAANNGIGIEFLWNDSPLWAPIATMVTFTLSLGFLLLFARRLLATRSIMPRLERLLAAATIVHFALPLGLLVAAPLFVKLGLFMAGLTGILVLVAGITGLIKRQRSAWFFVAAFSMLLLGGILTAMRGFGWVPTNAITTNGMQMGSALEMLLLAFLLADRFNAMRREKAKAQRDALQAQNALVETLQSSERQLEERVIQRTTALSAANEELAEAYKGAEISRQETERARQDLSAALDDSVRLQHELSAALKVAESADHAKSQLLANMSHEIRTPMNAILGMLTLLKKTPLNAKQRDYAGKTEGAARSLLGLLNDILDFSKVEAGKMALDIQAFALDRLLRDISVIVSANLDDKPVKVHFEIDPSLPNILLGDPLRLQQILTNLMSNAVKFTQQGEVVIHVQRGSGDTEVPQVRFSVTDTGIGISPANQQLIFDGFSQADASTTRLFGGTGLGLAISRRLVALMRGELQLDSVLGRGSRFFFEIPLPVVDGVLGMLPVNERSTQRVGEAVLAQQRRLEGMRILLVEDNLPNQQVATELLAGEGAQVVVADNGKRGVEALRIANPQFDVVLMDVQMPVMDGYTATGLIRQSLGLSNLPIIAMTANAMSSDKEACRAAGMDGYVAKPIDFDHLISIIRQACHCGDSALDAEAGVASGRPPSGEAVLEAETDADIDVDTALLRMCGNRSLYGGIVREVISRLGNASTELSRQLEHSDNAGVMRFLHTLKGLVGMVGADSLARAFADYELRLGQGMTPAAVDGMQADLARRFAQTVDRLIQVSGKFPSDKVLRTPS